jgi:hypothetical protein
LDPRQRAEGWVAQLGFGSLAVVDLDFDLGDAVLSGPGDLFESEAGR